MTQIKVLKGRLKNRKFSSFKAVATALKPGEKVWVAKWEVSGECEVFMGQGEVKRFKDSTYEYPTAVALMTNCM